MIDLLIKGLEMEEAINLMYHKLDTFCSKYTVPVCSFEHQVKMLHKTSNVNFTFDDGHQSDLIAADVLEKYNLHGIFFIVTSILGQPGFLTARDVYELHERGHVIGTHSHTHTTPFTQLNYDQLLNEWIQSKSILESITGGEVIIGSIPGGRLNKDVNNAAIHARLTKMFTSFPSYGSWDSKSLTYYGRICVMRSTSLMYFNHLIRHKSLFLEKTSYYGKNVVKRVVKPKVLKKINRFYEKVCSIA